MDELLSEFLTETSESLAALDTQLVKLEQNPEDKTLLSSIFRIMHTIKGTCGFLGLSLLESVAHSSENVLGKIRDGEMNVSKPLISMILESLDIIKKLVKELEATGKEPAIDIISIVTRLNDAASGKMPSESATTAPIQQTEQKKEESKAPEVIPTAPVVQEAQPIVVKEEPNIAKPDITQVVNDVEKMINNVLATDVVTKKLEEAPKVIEENHKQEEQPKPATNTNPATKALHEGTINNHGMTPVVGKKKDSKAASNAPAAPHQTIRVNVEVLEGLMQVVSELVLTRNQLLQIARANKDSGFNIPLQRLSHITSELQERVMKTRMQPIGNAWSQFPRMIRDLAIELGKKIDLTMIGEDTELDRQLIESIKDPLTHMIRNSADHGLELPDIRKAGGKDEVGRIYLKAYHQGGHIIIEISDDGKGLNTDKIKQKILSTNLATESELQMMTEQQIHQYIFRAGFSTADKVTAVSGRGVGMDVVKNNIEKISGTIELKSILGKGSTFTIKIPLTLAIMPILIVECNGGKFGIPQITIIEMVKAGHNCEYVIENVNKRLILRLRENLLPLVPLKEVLFPEFSGTFDINKDHFVVVCEVGSFTFGITVDKIYDTEEIVVKPVAPILKSIDVYSGSTLLGDGSVIMILDPNGLIKSLSDNSSKSDNSFTNRHRETNSVASTNKTTFLIFRAGKGANKAVPLDIVSRLEEIDVSKIEVSISKKVVQYRDALMQVALLNDTYEVNESGLQQIIVFIEKDNILGLAVEEIVDIVEGEVDSIVQTSKDGYIGSIIINDHTMDVIDLRYYFKKVFEKQDHMNITVKQGTRVLLIDDSPFFRKFVPPIMLKHGIDVTIAEGSEKAFDIMSHNKFDVIVTDINMPQIDGVEFCRLCRQEDRYKEIPIIALSANMNNGIIEKHEKIGFNAFVSKANIDEIIGAINDIISSNGVK